MSHYIVQESDQFIKDVEEAAVWILVTNIEQSESLAEKKIYEFNSELNFLKNRIQNFPESGENDSVEGVRKFPIYDGRYLAKWIVIHAEKTVIFISLSDSKYPKLLRQFAMDEDTE